MRKENWKMSRKNDRVSFKKELIQRTDEIQSSDTSTDFKMNHYNQKPILSEARLIQVRLRGYNKRHQHTFG